MKWFLYMLQCADGTIYTGITTDVEARIRVHNSGKGAKYTRGRTPVSLLAEFEFSDKPSALKAEYKIKQLSRNEKLKLISKKEVGN
jgi:putative endonuclease